MPPRDQDNATSVEFEGGTTRRGKIVLGVLSCAILYAAGAPRAGIALCASAFGVWAFAFADTVAEQHAAFQAAAKNLGATLSTSGSGEAKAQ